MEGNLLFQHKVILKQKASMAMIIIGRGVDHIMDKSSLTDVADQQNSVCYLSSNDTNVHNFGIFKNFFGDMISMKKI